MGYRQFYLLCTVLLLLFSTGCCCRRGCCRPFRGGGCDMGCGGGWSGGYGGGGGCCDTCNYPPNYTAGFGNEAVVAPEVIGGWRGQGPVVEPPLAPAPGAKKMPAGQ